MNTVRSVPSHGAMMYIRTHFLSIDQANVDHRYHIQIAQQQIISSLLLITKKMSEKAK